MNIFTFHMIDMYLYFYIVIYVYIRYIHCIDTYKYISIQEYIFKMYIFKVLHIQDIVYNIIFFVYKSIYKSI